jgi:uncharacterized membrane protein YvbJ
MKCRQCGTEIADKAIVCYRCGTATTEPVRKAAVVKPKGSPLIAGIITAVLVAIAVYLWRLSSTTANSELVQLAAGFALGAGVVFLVRGVLLRR